MLPENLSGLVLAQSIATTGDYGAARYVAYGIFFNAQRRLSLDNEAVNDSMKLISNIERVILQDFIEQARAKGLNITLRNRQALLEEHSPHYSRYNESKRRHPTPAEVYLEVFDKDLKKEAA